MISYEELCNVLLRHGFTFFSGVPDSILCSLPEYVDGHEHLTNVIAVNECEAVAVCAGHYLATGNPGVVYMQNSGLGKTVNPLSSLCDASVYSIPVLLMIGWRGEPGQPDEPQHEKMGRITTGLLDTLGVPYAVPDGATTGIDKCITEARQYLEKKQSPYALILRRGLLDEHETAARDQICVLTRETAIASIIDVLSDTDVVISTTGKTSRELFELRDNAGSGHERDFYVVGSMGCASAIGFGIAKEHPAKKVVVIDGDGSILMQMGTLATIGHYKPPNLLHIVMDNEAHESTGGQPTVAGTVDMANVARNCGYREAITVDGMDDLVRETKRLRLQDGPAMVVVKVRAESRKNLGRPNMTPIERKNEFMAYLRECPGK